MDIPDEILLTTFSYLDSARDKLVLTRVSRQWRRLAIDLALWRNVRVNLSDFILLTRIRPNMEVDLLIEGMTEFGANQWLAKKNDPKAVTARRMANQIVAAEKKLDWDTYAFKKCTTNVLLRNLSTDELQMMASYFAGGVVVSFALEGWHSSRSYPALSQEKVKAEAEQLLLFSSMPQLQHFSLTSIATPERSPSQPQFMEDAFPLYCLLLPNGHMESIRMELGASFLLFWFERGFPITSATQALRVLALRPYMSQHNLQTFPGFGFPEVPLLSPRRFPALEEIDLHQSESSLFGSGPPPPRLTRARMGLAEEGRAYPACYPHLTSLTVCGNNSIAFVAQRLVSERFPVLQELTVEDNTRDQGEVENTDDSDISGLMEACFLPFFSGSPVLRWARLTVAKPRTAEEFPCTAHVRSVAVAAGLQFHVAPEETDRGRLVLTLRRPAK